MGCCLAQVGGESSSGEVAFVAIPGEERGMFQGQGQGSWLRPGDGGRGHEESAGAQEPEQVDSLAGQGWI